MTASVTDSAIHIALKSQMQEDRVLSLEAEVETLQKMLG
jgi:hypothetical protein